MKQFWRLHRESLGLFFLAALVVGVLFLFENAIDYGLLDEGYLWYGVQRVLLSEVPIRDFVSYDPGRYYYSAALMALWGTNSIIALRGTLAILQVFGLFTALLLIVRSSPKLNRSFFEIALVTLTIWMLPCFKMFDIVISILLVAILSFLVKKPTDRRYFLTGLCIGIIAVFGRNHGIYGAVGTLGVMAYLALGHHEGPGCIKGLLLWGGGVIVGYLPVLVMLVTIPDFAPAFWYSIYFLFEVKATNASLSLPWIWTIPFGHLSPSVLLCEILVSLFFMTLTLFVLLGILWVFYQRFRKKSLPPILVSAIILSLPYTHYVYSRADLGHMCHSIFPFLIGAFILLARQPKKIWMPVSVLLCITSLLLLIPGGRPLWKCCVGQCVPVNVLGSMLNVPLATAQELQLLTTLASQFAPGDRSFITPLWPGAYAALGRKAPLREIFALQPRSEVFEKDEVERIKYANPGFAIVPEGLVDGQSDRRFRETHPLTHQYIMDHFEPLPTCLPYFTCYKHK